MTSALADCLCLFFLLSAFLISELLLREHETTGTVHLKAFYVRRILRIWPLYYFAVSLGLLIGFRFPEMYGLSIERVTYLILFVAWLGGDFHGNPAGPLWSISVEELFYLLWPSIAKPAGRRSLLIGSTLVTLLSLVSAGVFWRNWWYNPTTHFLFFSSGALLALFLHRREFKLSLLFRLTLFLAGIAMWMLLPANIIQLPGPALNLARYCLVDIGCVVIFLAFVNIEAFQFPQWTLYLGRISYGLYVFHLFILVGITDVLLRWHANMDRWLVVLAIQASALLITVAVASASYRYLERPFLRLKQRFTFVRSGAPVAS